MLLTPEQHRRGFVRWRGETEVTVTIASIDGAARSTPMDDKRGSVPDFVPVGDGEIKVLPTSGTVVGPPFGIVWDRLVGDDIEARGFDTDSGAFHLVGMTGPGRLERLVVEVPYLRWDTPWTVRVGDIAVRFVNRLLLERPSDESFIHEGDVATFTTT